MSDRKTIHRAAKVRANTYDPDERTIDVVWSTGAPVRRFDWDGEFNEVLSMDPSAVRLGRLNAGASVLDTHDGSELERVIGSVVPVSARIEGGKGLATVRLSAAKGCADTVLKIVEGTIRNISVGYWIHSQSETEADGLRTVTATDWEPLELSAVPVPADPGAQFRSAGGRRAAPAGREAEIRRMARKAGLPKLGERHVREGTSAADFFDLLAARLAGSSTRKDSITMTKRKSNGADDLQRAMDKGAAEARALRGTPLGSGLDTYAHIGRADDAKKRPEDDDDDADRDDEASDDDTGEEVEDEDAEDTKADAEAAAKRGAETVRNLMGKGVRSSAASSLANIREHRREAKRADGRQVDDALGHEAGRREARKLLGK